jgi:hypothetical protein
MGTIVSTLACFWLSTSLHDSKIIKKRILNNILLII